MFQLKKKKIYKNFNQAAVTSPKLLQVNIEFQTFFIMSIQKKEEPSAHERFKERLIRLSIDIEDKEKNIQILNEEINEQPIRLKKEMQELRQKYQMELSQKEKEWEDKLANARETIENYNKETRDLDSLSHKLDKEIEVCQSIHISKQI